MNKIYLVSCLLLSLLASNQVQAQTGFKVGLNLWSQQASGVVEYEGERANVQGDFGITTTRESIKLYFETIDVLVFFPNFRFYYDIFEQAGKTSQLYTFGGLSFAEGASVNIRSKALGVTAFYSHRFFKLIGTRLGLDIRNTSFEIKVSNMNAITKANQEVTYSGTKEVFPFIPLAYAQVSIDIPTTSMYVYAEGQYTNLVSNAFFDYKAAAGIKLYGVYLESGYRNFSYAVKNTTKATHVDLNISGPFFEASYVF